MKLLNWVPVITAAALLMLVSSLQVSADEDEHEGKGRGESHESRGGLMKSNEAWQTECSACHMAYPPRMLPADSWKAVMDGLSDHFGSDASLDEATFAEINAFLQDNAGQQRGKVPAEPVLRITDSSWFKRQHHEISPLTWKRASIKSASNCAACHTQAEKGNFDEDWVKIPR